MRGLIVAAVIVVVVIAAFAFGLIDINQTKKTQLPDVAIEGGQAPAFDVDTADVDVGTKQESIKVPDVDVKTKDETIEVPTVSVNKAN